jgi:hypothetical protein
MEDCWIVQIDRPGCEFGPRFIKPATTKIDMQRWCDEFNGGGPEVARVIHRSEKKECPDN